MKFVNETFALGRCALAAQALMAHNALAAMDERKKHT
jgi:hypothetical protein